MDIKLILLNQLAIMLALSALGAERAVLEERIQYTRRRIEEWSE